MKKATLNLILALTFAAISYNTAYCVWWNPLTWFEKDTKSAHQETEKGTDLYKTPTICPQAAVNTPAGELKPAQPTQQAAQIPKTSATPPFAAQDNCPTGQQLCVGNLGDDNNATFCSAGDCPMGSAPVLNKPLAK